MYILYNQRDAIYTMFVIIIISALHVSGGFSAPHQELIKLYVQPWVLSCFPGVYRWCGWVETHSRKAWQYPRLHIQFYKLPMMGGKTARNMYSADNNKEHCVSCISLVIWNIITPTQQLNPSICGTNLHPSTNMFLDIHCAIWGSHSCGDEYYSLLWCHAV